MRKETKKLLKENNELCGQLSGEGNQVLTDMVVYLRGCNISMYDQERVRRDITQMLIDGERRGDTASTVIGEDYRSFCDNVVSEIPKLSRGEKAAQMVHEIFLTAAVLTGIWWIGSVMETGAYFFLGRSVSPLLSVTLGNVLGGVVFMVAAEWLLIYLVKHTFQQQGKWDKKWFVMFMLAVLAGLCLNIGLKQVLFRIHFISALAVILIILGVCWIMGRKVD